MLRESWAREDGDNVCLLRRIAKGLLVAFYDNDSACLFEFCYYFESLKWGRQAWIIDD